MRSITLEELFFEYFAEVIDATDDGFMPWVDSLLACGALIEANQAYIRID